MTQTQPTQIDLNSVFNIMFMMIFMVMMMKMMDKVLAPSEEHSKLPPVKAPPGYVPVGTPRKAPTRVTEEEELQEKKKTLENRARDIAREAGVEFLRLEEGWEGEYTTPRYWFKDPTIGQEFIALDLEDLKWKLSIIRGEHHSPGEKIWYLGEWWKEEYGTAECIVYRSADGKKRLYAYWDGTKEVKPASGIYITITDPGKTTFKIGEVVFLEAFEKENERVRKLGEKPALGTRKSLSTEEIALLDPQRFPKRTKALAELGEYEVIQVHDDGDLTVRSRGRLYVVTTEGEVFVHYTGEEALKKILGKG